MPCQPRDLSKFIIKNHRDKCVLMEAAGSSGEADLIVLETLLQMCIKPFPSFTQFFKAKENP